MSAIDTFRRHCRTNAYALWTGTWDYYAFMDAMIPEIENGYQAAWHEALAAHGMEPEDATEEEERYVADAQAQASSHLNDLAEWIEAHARDGNDPLLLAVIHGRIDLWVNDLQRLITWANTELAGNEKLQWVYGETEEHCRDCATYVGRVYRARAWARVGALPQSRELECGGWRCDCRLEPTTARANRGFPPKPSGTRTR